MKKHFYVTAAILFTLSSLSTNAAECKKEEAQAAVEKACKLIEAKNEGALDEIKAYKFCGDNYVWIQDSDVKMVLHPIKPRLNGKSLMENKDPAGKLLFVEFDKMAKANAAGGWVDYQWPKPGAEEATDKVSFVKMCAGPKKWIAGSGVWK